VDTTHWSIGRTGLGVAFPDGVGAGVTGTGVTGVLVTGAAVTGEAVTGDNVTGNGAGVMGDDVVGADVAGGTGDFVAGRGELDIGGAEETG